MFAPVSQLQACLTAPEACNAQSLVMMLRHVKNHIIGNQHKKHVYLQQGVLNFIAVVARTPDAPEVWVQCADCIGSFARSGRQAVQQIEAVQLIDFLIRLLASDDLNVLKSAVRALGALAKAVPHTARYFRDAGVRQRLVVLTRHASLEFVEGAISLLAACAEDREAATLLLESGALPALLERLRLCTHTQPQPQTLVATHPSRPHLGALRRVTLAAIAALLAATQAGRTQPVDASSLPGLVDGVRCTDNETKLFACQALVFVLCQDPKPSWLDAAALQRLRLPKLFPRSPLEGGEGCGAEGGGREAEDCVTSMLLALVVPSLMTLLESDLRRAVPDVLLRVIGHDDRLKRAVMDGNVLEHLAALVTSEAESIPELPPSTGLEPLDATSTSSPPGGSTSPPPHLLGALKCLHVLCSPVQRAPGRQGRLCNHDERKQAAICTSATANALARCLRHPDASVRQATAQSFRVLGRNGEARMKDSFADAAVVHSFIEGLRDPAVSVRISVCHAVCNFVAATSATRRPLLEKGVICELAHIASSLSPAPESAQLSSAELELQTLLQASLYALGNAVHLATLELREQLVGSMPWVHMRRMLLAPSLRISAYAWKVLQNLAHRSNFEDSVQLMQWSCNELMDAVDEVLKRSEACLESDGMDLGSGRSEEAEGVPNETHPLVCSMFVLNNLATAKEQKSLVLEPAILRHVAAHLGFSAPDPDLTKRIQIASCWVVTNLLYPPDESAQTSAEQVQQMAQQLVDAGVLDALTQLKTAMTETNESEDAELLERAKIALRQIDDALAAGRVV